MPSTTRVAIEQQAHPTGRAIPLAEAVALGEEKLLNPEAVSRQGGIETERPVLVTLTAGKGTRFGASPKCAQPVNGTPVARHSIDAFRRAGGTTVVSVVGYRHTEVMRSLGDDVAYILSGDPAGGTAYAAYEAFTLRQLLDADPLLIICMGDRVVTPGVFGAMLAVHEGGEEEAALTFLAAEYAPPRNKGKGRVVRDTDGRVLRLVEQRDIDALEDAEQRETLDALVEANCPLYVIRARKLHECLCPLGNDNAQTQYYLTDIIEAIARDGGEVRTVTITEADPDYSLLVSDVTRPTDLARLEEILRSRSADLDTSPGPIVEAARAIVAGRPRGQVAAIAAQLEELQQHVVEGKLGFDPDSPCALGISGGRLRIAFMHPDMGRFYGPAWQMPIGAKDAAGREQILVLAQATADRRLYVHPTNPEFCEELSSIPADSEWLYPPPEVDDWYTYEAFGTRMAEGILASLGYITEEELRRLREAGRDLPPQSRWVSANMRRPFALVGNALASKRTVRMGAQGERVQAALGRDGFAGLRVACTGNIPRGGFASSSAVTVATQNAVNALYSLGLPAEMLVHLACQAEYGTGVRAGSLDQATEQNGRAGRGTLISSNPRENYRPLGTYPVPAQRFRVFFPYTVDRDREAWRWSAGMYAGHPEPGRLTSGEVRKMTGKAAEIAAVLLRLPLDVDFFQQIERDLLEDGQLDVTTRLRVYHTLRALPLAATVADLRAAVAANKAWYAAELERCQGMDAETARRKAESTLASLFADWREPKGGVPLRAMVGYLFGEVAKNAYLVSHPDEWIECVTRSQAGDRCFEIDAERLPEGEAMLGKLDWEAGLAGPALMEAWLARCGAVPFDVSRDIEDDALDAGIAAMTRVIESGSGEPAGTPLHHLRGTNFFRGLALIDLVEAMLKRAFGGDAVAVRVNAAGQGDFFQVHVDTTKAAPAEVRRFIRKAVYERFGLKPAQGFVETHPGGGAVGVRLDRFDQLPLLVAFLRRQAGGSGR